MADTFETKIEEVRAQGEFQGMVRTSLLDIKTILNDMKEKHAIQDSKIEQKVDKTDFATILERVNNNTPRKDHESLSTRVADLEKWRWYLAGGLVVVSFVINAILK